MLLETCIELYNNINRKKLRQTRETLFSVILLPFSEMDETIYRVKFGELTLIQSYFFFPCWFTGAIAMFNT